MRQEHPRPCVNTSPATSPATLPTISRNRLYPTRHRTDIPAPRTYIHEGMHEGDYMHTNVYVRCMGESGILRDIGLFDSSKARIQQPHRPGTTAASSQPNSQTAPAIPPQPYRRSQAAAQPNNSTPNALTAAPPKTTTQTAEPQQAEPSHAHTATTAYSHNRQQPQTTAQPVQ